MQVSSIVETWHAASLLQMQPHTGLNVIYTLAFYGYGWPAAKKLISSKFSIQNSQFLVYSSSA
jgi:hypothetical protein